MCTDVVNEVLGRNTKSRGCEFCNTYACEDGTFAGKSIKIDKRKKNYDGIPTTASVMTFIDSEPIMLLLKHSEIVGEFGISYCPKCGRKL
jgi:hypothetical protein